MRCSRSNHFDVLSDLLRDVVRREKVQTLLASREASIVTQKKPGYFGDMNEYDSDTDEDFQPPVDPVAAVDEAATMFRGTAGTRIAVVDVHLRLPTEPPEPLRSLPFASPVPFADRLGVFLADGAELSSGAYPQPDDGTVTVFPVAHIEATPTSMPFRVHARQLFRGKAKYSFMELQAEGGELWYCCVWLLFTCIYNRRSFRVALVSWLSQRSGLPYGTTKPTFSWTSRHLDCVEIGHFTRPVVMVSSGCKRNIKGDQVFHLLE